MRRDQVREGTVLVSATACSHGPVFHDHRVVRITSDGFWITPPASGKGARWDWKRKQWLTFATRKVSLTREEAVVQLLWRKVKEIEILMSRASYAASMFKAVRAYAAAHGIGHGEVVRMESRAANDLSAIANRDRHLGLGTWEWVE